VSAAKSGSNREHEDHDCPIERHGEVTAMIGGLGIGYVTAHEDGTVLASIDGTRQRRPYRFKPSRDKVRLRSEERGQQGERARSAIRWSGWEVVESDRRGRDAGGGMTDEDRQHIAAEMVAEIERQKRRGIADPTAEAARQLSKRPIGLLGLRYGRTTILDVYRAPNREPSSTSVNASTVVDLHGTLKPDEVIDGTTYHVFVPDTAAKQPLLDWWESKNRRRDQ